MLIWCWANLILSSNGSGSPLWEYSGEGFAKSNYLVPSLVWAQTSKFKPSQYIHNSPIPSVIMGMILGYGICSLLGLFYSAAHTVIPFILLGIGIDNIFVITQTFKTLGMYIKVKS